MKVTPDDRVKVLDFGLAKAVETETSSPNAASSPTLSMMASQAGIILGTAAYMSPEQAKGIPADHRSDIFSFGSLLFEMLTGRQPFQGDTAPEVLASVLVREADISRLPKDLNPRIVQMVRRCLEKQPKRRWQAVGDVRAELEAIAAVPRTEPLSVGPVRPLRPLWRRAMPAVIAALVAGSLAAAAAWMLRPAPAAPVVRFSIALPGTQRFSAVARRVAAISPDGTLIAYVADRRIILRPIRDLQSTPLAGTENVEGIAAPAFSPDGKSLAFYASGEGALKRIAVSGGMAVTLCPAVNPSALAWGPGGIVFDQSVTDARQVLRVAANGGQPEVLVRLQPNELPDGPQMLPDGDTVLFTLATNTRVGADRWDNAQVIAQSVKSGARKGVIDGGSDARYLPTGHLAYAIGGTIYVGNHPPAVSGRPALVAAPVRHDARRPGPWARDAGPGHWDAAGRSDLRGVELVRGIEETSPWSLSPSSSVPGGPATGDRGPGTEGLRDQGTGSTAW